MQGDLQLTFATEEESEVTVLGRNEAQAPTVGEVIYKDEIGTICRRWNWREVARSVLRDETTNCVLVIVALNPVSDETLSNAINELENLVKKYCGGKTSSKILIKDDSSFEM